MKATAELVIIPRPSGAMSYRLYVDRHMVWCTRAHSTAAGQDGARERLRQWLRAHPYKVVLVEKEAA